MMFIDMNDETKTTTTNGPGIYPVPTKRSDNKVIRKECPSLIIDTGKKPMLVYDLGNCYLNAYTMRKIYPKTAKILVEHATKQDYAYALYDSRKNRKSKHETRTADFIQRSTRDDSKTVANWINVSINSEIDRHIDNIANNLNSSSNKCNANLLIYDLEIIRDEAESKVADIQRLIHKINDRLLEIGRKSMLRKGDIVCNDETSDLFLRNNIFRNVSYLGYKYRITRVRFKQSACARYIISKKGDNKWLPLTTANSKTWLCFDSYAKARQYVIKLINFGTKEEI